MNTYESSCFPIGLCEYPVQIEYEQFSDGDVEINVCRIDVSGDADHDVWATVEPDYYPPIERELKRELEEEIERERDEDGTPYEAFGNVPYFLRKQAQ